MASVPAIAAYATHLSQTQLRQDVGVAVAKKARDAARTQGDAAVAMLEVAAQFQAQNTPPPEAPGSFPRATAPPASPRPNGLPHLGQRLDVLA